jgi:hypothetical protein
MPHVIFGVHCIARPYSAGATRKPPVSSADPLAKHSHQMSSGVLKPGRYDT